MSSRLKLHPYIRMRPEEMEDKVFNVSKSKEEYMENIAVIKLALEISDFQDYYVRNIFQKIGLYI